MSLRVRILKALSVRKRKRDLPVLRDLVGPGPEVRVLDIGGGAGAATARYGHGAKEIVIVEPDARKIAFGRRRFPGITFHEAKAERLPFPDGSFERVVAVVSFHHVEDPDLALREVRRVLVPEGLFVMHEMYPGDHPGVLAHVLGRRMHGTDPHFYEPEDLARLVGSHGFLDPVLRDGARGYFIVARK